MNRFLFACLLAGCTTAVPALPTLAATRDVHESRPAAARGHVEIENVAGSVEVIGADTGDVDVRGTLGARVERLEVTGSPEHVSVRAILPRGAGGGADSEARLQVRVPKGSSVRVELVSATLRTSGVQGDQDVQSVSGAIEGSAAARLDVQTVSGQVHLTRQSAGPTELKSVSGQLWLDGALGNVQAKSVSGVIRLEAAAPPDAQVSLESLSGAISSCGAPPAQSKGFGPGRRLVYRSGNGSGHIRAETVSGAIRLCAGGR